MIKMGHKKRAQVAWYGSDMVVRLVDGGGGMIFFLFPVNFMERNLNWFCVVKALYLKGINLLRIIRNTSQISFQPQPAVKH